MILIEEKPPSFEGGFNIGSKQSHSEYVSKSFWNRHKVAIGIAVVGTIAVVVSAALIFFGGPLTWLGAAFAGIVAWKLGCGALVIKILTTVLLTIVPSAILAIKIFFDSKKDSEFPPVKIQIVSLKDFTHLKPPRQQLREGFQQLREGFQQLREGFQQLREGFRQVEQQENKVIKNSILSINSAADSEDRQSLICGSCAGHDSCAEWYTLEGDLNPGHDHYFKNKIGNLFKVVEPKQCNESVYNNHGKKIGECKNYREVYPDWIYKKQRSLLKPKKEAQDKQYQRYGNRKIDYENMSGETCYDCV